MVSIADIKKIKELNACQDTVMWWWDHSKDVGNCVDATVSLSLSVL